MSNERVDYHVLGRYELEKKIGSGAYGVVWRVRDREELDGTGPDAKPQIVALKKSFGAFRNPTDAQRTYREVTILSQVKHPNLVSLIRVHRADDERDIYLVFETCETDLGMVINSSHRLLKDVHIRFIFWQLLCAIKYLHSADIVHRDVKPSNVLINSDCTIKLCDFGLARTASDEFMTDYVSTRWFRPPEVLASAEQYTNAVDIWGAGVVLAEMYLGRPLFPGDDAREMLEMIGALVHYTDKDIEDLKAPAARSLMSGVAPRQRSWHEVLEGVPEDGLDMIRKCLKFNPRKRITAARALEHPFVAPFHDPQKEFDAPKEIVLKLPDSQSFLVNDYRDALYREVAVRLGQKARSGARRRPATTAH